MWWLAMNKSRSTYFQSKKIGVLLALSIISTFWASVSNNTLILLIPVASVFYAYYFRLLDRAQLIAAVLFGIGFGLLPEVVKWLMNFLP
jgi:hypothetical protein